MKNERNAKPVTINIIANVSYGNENNNVPVQLITTGFLYEMEDYYELCYKELSDEDESNDPETEITLVFKKNTVLMKRIGAFSNEMIFEKGRRFEGVYHTPYGDMSMAVYSTLVNYDADCNEGYLVLKYQLDLQGNYASTNELHLQFHRINE